MRNSESIFAAMKNPSMSDLVENVIGSLRDDVSGGLITEREIVGIHNGPRVAHTEYFGGVCLCS